MVELHHGSRVWRLFCGECGSGLVHVLGDEDLTVLTASDDGMISLPCGVAVVLMIESEDDGSIINIVVKWTGILDL